MNAAAWTVILFTLTYVGLAIGKIPGLRTDRAGIALAGAAAVMGGGLLSFDEAVASIDFKTIALLLGMMIVVAYLRRAGFFDVLTDRVLGRLRSPKTMLAVVMTLSGFLSALLVNDVVCLALAPLVLDLARRLKFDPKPQLIGLAVASNIGSVATLTGNPQNMIIGGFSLISYPRFAARLTPIALVGLVVAYFVTLWVYRVALRTTRESPVALEPSAFPRKQYPLLVKTTLVTLAAVVLFFTGANLAVVALGAAAILLLDRIEPRAIYRQVDWGLLVMFAGLFVVVRAFEVHVLSQFGVSNWPALREDPVGLLTLVSATLSNLVSNVPAVLLFKPIITGMPPEVRETAWLALAMSSTFAGNLTILGSVANLIVVENARREGVPISFLDYCRVGVPVTLMTLLLGVGWLMYVRY